MNRSTLYLLTGGIFLTATAELVVAGILADIAKDLHISIGMAGLLITAYSLAYAIGTPVVISMTAAMGRKKLLISSLLLFIAGCLCAALWTDYIPALVARCILGLCSGVFFVVTFNSVAKLVPSEKLGRAVGTAIIGFSSAIVLGVPLGISIADWLGWRYVFILLAILCFIILLGIMRSLPEIEGDAPTPFRKQFLVLANPIILSGMGITFFRDAGNSVMYAYLTPYLESILHLNAAAIGSIMLIFGIFGVFGSRLGGNITDKWGTKRIIASCIAIHVAALAIVPVASVSLFAGLIFFAAWVFSMFVVAPALQTYFIQAAPRSSNLVLSLNTSVTHLGLASGAMVGGVTANLTSGFFYHPWAASMVIAVGFFAAMISFKLGRQNRQLF
ncbi:MFS transporter [Cohnella sp. CFH 77786]|uniref:MFS transporter n=1 Tax=Cohnella sp. CFH 77786 TaxID=2662265 RepID=UPI001C60C3B2|nr:MFS transporter [Cohnella sp. CFH 77786]MBW5446188.1 MFS transporter [Cohnella sp. CFH 77786]